MDEKGRIDSDGEPRITLYYKTGPRSAHPRRARADSQLVVERWYRWSGGVRGRP